MWEELVKKSKEVAIGEIEKTNFPSLVNLEISAKKAEDLADRYNVNKQLVLVGAYLMDVQLGEAKKQNRLPEHAKMGMEFTKEFLENYDTSEEDKKKILNCVEAHHGTIPYICKEAEICANADAYRFIHPKAVFSNFYNDNGMKYNDLLDLLINKLEEKYRVLSLPEVKEELEPYYQKFKNLFEIAKTST